MTPPIQRLALDHPEILAKQARGEIGPVGVVYESPWARLRVDPVRWPSGAVGTHVVYALPSAPEGAPVGTVVVARRPGAMLGDEPELLVQWQWRHCLQAWSLEVPRGAVQASDADPIATGLRELAEETGAPAPPVVELVGVVAADTGRLSDRNAVVAAWYPRSIAGTADRFHLEGADPEEALGTAFWLPVSQWLRLAGTAPRPGEPVGPLCGITLSALALAQARSPHPSTI